MDISHSQELASMEPMARASSNVQIHNSNSSGDMLFNFLLSSLSPHLIIASRSINRTFESFPAKPRMEDQEK